MRFNSVCKNVVLVALVLAAGAVFAVVPAQSEEIAIAFTGQAFSALYPCNCPDNPEGGVSRRGTAIKALRKEYPRLLVVEAGSSFGSGAQDPSSQNVPLDTRRTEIYLDALKTMGLDALLVSGQEYVFGADFLARFKELPFVSSNVEGAGAPFILKKVGSSTIGILGLTDALARSRGAASWVAPRQGLAGSVGALKKKGANFIIVLSALTSEDDAKLLKEVPGIDLVINGAPFLGSVDLTKTDAGSRWVQTWWQAKKIGVLVLEIAGRDIKWKRISAVDLAPGAEDDPDVLAVMPACFQAGDCKKMPGLKAQCDNGGTPKAACLYAELPAVPLKVIVPRACQICRTDVVLGDLEKIFGKIKPSVIFEDAPQAQALIKSFGLKMLPAYIVGADLETQESFATLSKVFDRRGSSYVLKPEVAGVSYFIERKREPNRLDVFFDLNYSMLEALCLRISEFQALHREVTVRFHFLVAWDQASGFKLMPGSGNWDIEEYKRAVCVEAVAPELLMRYMACRASKRDPVLWESCAQELGLDVAKIKEAVDSGQGESLLKEQIKLTKELEVATGPTFVVENKEVFGISGVPSIVELERAAIRNDRQTEQQRGFHENEKTK